MKYDMSKIMKAAWELHRSYSARALTFGECLKRAWAQAKEEMAEAAEIARVSGKKFTDGMEIFKIILVKNKLINLIVRPKK